MAVYPGFASLCLFSFVSPFIYFFAVCVLIFPPFYSPLILLTWLLMLSNIFAFFDGVKTQGTDRIRPILQLVFLRGYLVTCPVWLGGMGLLLLLLFVEFSSVFPFVSGQSV